MENHLYLIEKYKKKPQVKTLLAILLGLLTAFFCLYLADGVFGIQGLKITEYLGNSVYNTPIYDKRVDSGNQTGAVIFWFFVIGLPVLFSRWISWRDTLVNYWLYPVYWLVVDDLILPHPGNAFLNTGTEYYPKLFFNVDLNFSPFTWTLFIFLVHSAVFMCVKNFWKRPNE